MMKLCLKGSLKEKMFGDEWQQFANLRLLLPSCLLCRKVVFLMGGEFGVPEEWNLDESLDWGLDYPYTEGAKFSAQPE